MKKPVNLDDYELLAREKLPGPAFDFIAGGAEDELTLRDNRLAFQRLQLRPRVLVDVSRVDPSTEVLGQRIDFPALVAPVALQKLAHPDGELAVARAAAAAGTVMLLSTISSVSLEDVARETEAPKWFQLYCYKDREVTRRIVQRARDAGYRAICLTVDVPKLGNRERDFRNALQFPPDVFPVNLAMEVDLSAAPPEARTSLEAAGAAGVQHPSLTWEIAPDLTWADVAWVRSLTDLPLLLKGILTAEDALLAAEHGAAAVIVSNHGGRQLDGSPAAIDVLPEIVDALGGRVEVLVDGGVRRGTDVLKALALGAKAVLLGRPYVFALAAGGERGVRRALSILRAEFELAMALSGVTSVAGITRALVR
ncbi:MAG: alpha-hydroxy acid oxidase [Dehalococcoidia bacterium]|nr:alpha-hydroxy acid oxidase [Dehalococcoidia bacterium]